MSHLGARRALARRPSTPATLWAFARPHTVVGTLAAVGGLWAMAGLAAGSAAWPAATTTAGAVAAALAANVFIVGLNQIRDVELDRANKPWLPLPSGALSCRAARAVVLGAGTASVAVAATQGTALLLTVVVGMLVGAAYSLPPAHLKVRAGPAAAAIALVRGPVLNLGLYAHLAGGLPPPAGRVALLPPAVWALLLASTGMAVAVSLAKDVPDVAGDRRYGVATLAVTRGPRAAFVVARRLVAVTCAAVAVVGLIGLPGVHGPVLAVAELALAAWWLRVSGRALGSDPGRPTPDAEAEAVADADADAVAVAVAEADVDPVRVTQAYRALWLVLCAQYAVFPLAVLAHGR